MLSRLLLYIIILLVISTPCLAENNLSFSIRVESLERGKILLNFPTQTGERFYIHYIHSSAKTPVQDIIEISEEGKMILIEESFYWHGAGLEFMNWEKATITMEKGKIKVHLKRPLPYLYLRVGRVANHTLIVNGVTISLKDIARGGELLKIWVGPRDHP